MGRGVPLPRQPWLHDLKNSGLLYETGTGVEELAFLARQHGYQGTSAFHDWTFDQLGEQLGEGRPVVVSLGANGEGQPGHFVTLTGISEDGQWVSYNDPMVGKQTIPAADFQKLWDLGGNAGLVARKEPISAVDDPLLPWMGLFSAMAALAVMAKHYPPGNELTSTLENIRDILSNPLRKGLGGKLIAGGGSSSSPPYTAPPGYSWKKNIVPVYGWKDVTITEKVEVPNLVRTWAVVKVNRWIERVPVYKTVTIDRGYWAYRTVTKYRTERYRTTERYKTKKYYWYRRNGRLVRGSYDVWNTRTVVKTRQVPYTERQKYWVPKIVTEKRLDYYREVEHRDPVYGWREEKQGTRIEEHTKTTRAWAPVGTEIKWELEKLPVPEKPMKPPVHKPESPKVEEPVLETVPSIFINPLGWFQASVINLGRQNETVGEFLTDTLAPASEWLQGFPDKLDDFANNLRESAQEMVKTGIEGWAKAHESAKIIAGYTFDAIKDGRWEDVGNVIKELKEAPGEVVDALIEEYDDLPFITQVGIGLAPGGDAIDIVKEGRNGKKGEPVDKFVLGLSIFGLIMDLGWADGIIPDPADGGNAAAAFLKSLLKQLDVGPSRETIERMLKNPNEYGKIIEAIQELTKNSEFISKIDKPEVFVRMLESGSEGIALLSKNGDTGIKLINDHGVEMADFLIRHSDETGTAAQNAMEVIEAGKKLANAAPGSDEAAELADQIAKLSTHGSGDRVVLGEWLTDGGYIDEAVDNGGIYFETPEAYWKEIGENADISWEVNKKFLDQQLEAGKDIYFHGDILKTLEDAAGTSRWRELEYLFDYVSDNTNGYEFIDEINTWRKVSN